MALCCMGAAVSAFATPNLACAEVCVANAGVGFNFVGSTGDTYTFLGGDPCNLANWAKTDCCSSLIDNGDGTYTSTDGNGNVVILDFNADMLPFAPLATTLTSLNVRDAIEEVATKTRPFQVVGQAADATNEDNVPDAATIFHTGDVVLSGTTQGNNANLIVEGTVAFGANNHSAMGANASVLSGSLNTASGTNSAATGGSNTASGANSTAIGGLTNVASGIGAGVVGGTLNTANGGSSSVTGGASNTASGTNSAIVGGSSNTATNTASAVIGGISNKAIGARSVIAGGSNNTANALGNFISGTDNTSDGTSSGVFGGTTNTILSANGPSLIVGGHNNTILATAGESSGIFNGNSNTIASTGTHNSIIGGGTNAINGAGDTSTITGGSNNTINLAAGVAAYASGVLSTITHSGAYVHNTGLAFASVANNEFAVKAIGGFRMFNDAALNGWTSPSGTVGIIAVSSEFTKEDLSYPDITNVSKRFEDLHMAKYRTIKVNYTDEQIAAMTTDEEKNEAIAYNATQYPFQYGIIAESFNEKFGDFITPKKSRGFNALAIYDVAGIMAAAITDLSNRVTALGG